jgi:uncharacterized protein YlxW (UPF0749 family)
MTGDLDERLRAVERALVDDEPPGSIARATELATEVDDVEARLDELAERVLTLEAAVQALRGYAAHVRDEDRECRTDAALARVAGMEARPEDRE